MSKAEQAGTALQTPMHERRPDWVRFKIARNYEKMRDTADPSYGSNGEKPDYQFFPRAVGNYMCASGLIMEMEERLDRSLRILDIGAGAGRFVLAGLERGHEVQGVSAHDYRFYPRFDEITRHLPAEAYVVDDAHNLAQLPELGDDYDLIVSDLVFIHLVDPLSVLEQAANKLNSDGLLAVNGIDNGTSYAGGTNAEQVIGAFWATGFDVGVSRYVPYTIELQTVIADRNSSTQPLRLPVEYRDSPYVSV